MGRQGKRRLYKTMRRLRRSPLTRAEWQTLWARLERQEAEVEQLGERAAKERADVEWVEHPVVRFGLWMTGQLEERERKERGEYDAAVAETLRKGGAAKALRDYLESLDADIPRVTDARVAGDLEGVDHRDLRHLPEAGPALYGLLNRAHLASELHDIAEICEEAVRSFGAKRSKRSAQAQKRALVRIRKRLRRAGQDDLLPRVDGVPSGADYEDRLALHRLAEVLGERARDHRRGLAAGLRDVIQEARRPPGLIDS